LELKQERIQKVNRIPNLKMAVVVQLMKQKRTVERLALLENQQWKLIEPLRLREIWMQFVSNWNLSS
jgi:hypothetical protein